MKQHPISPPVVLRPGDDLGFTHKVAMHQNHSRPVTLVGWRWEPVFAEDLPVEAREALERDAVSEALI